MRLYKYILATSVVREHETLRAWAEAPTYEEIGPAMAHSEACDYVDRESAARAKLGIPGVRE